MRATGVGRRLLAVGLLLTGAAAFSGSAQPSAGRHTTVAFPDSRGPSPGPPLGVVALGDSVRAGSGCGCTPFPVRYAASLAAG